MFPATTADTWQLTCRGNERRVQWVRCWKVSPGASPAAGAALPASGDGGSMQREAGKLPMWAGSMAAVAVVWGLKTTSASTNSMLAHITDSTNLRLEQNNRKLEKMRDSTAQLRDSRNQLSADLDAGTLALSARVDATNARVDSMVA